MKVSDLKERFRILVGDSTLDIPTEFVISAINWAFNELPNVPKLSRIFSRHYQFNLDANEGWKWNLNGDFRRLSNMPMLNFWTSTGGDICKLNVCHRDEVEFFTKNGIIEMKQKGTPCEYTIEKIDDNIFLIFDRPLDIPVIIDYIAYGFPKPVEDEDDEIDISAIAENLILQVMRGVWYREADDFAFAGAITDYLDNKYLPEAIQQLNKRWGNEAPIILGE